MYVTSALAKSRRNCRITSKKKDYKVSPTLLKVQIHLFVLPPKLNDALLTISLIVLAVLPPIPLPMLESAFPRLSLAFTC
jgi:hypothetical protein